MELKDLIGKHMLSGVDIGRAIFFADEYSNTVIFCLDEIKYLVQEDPEDGYRSSAKGVVVINSHIENTFEPVEVFCRMKGNGDYQNDVLEIYDVKTGLLVLAVGTGDTDDYYPYWVCEYYPENLHFNQGK